MKLTTVVYYVINLFQCCPTVIKPPCPPCKPEDNKPCTCDERKPLLARPKPHHHHSGGSHGGSSSASATSSFDSQSSSSSTSSSSSSTSSSSSYSSYTSTTIVSGDSNEGWSAAGYSFSGISCSMCGYTIPCSDSRCAGCFLSSSVTTSVTGYTCSSCDGTMTGQCGGCYLGSITGYSYSKYMCGTCASSSASGSCSGCSSSLVACNVCNSSNGECYGCASQSEKTTMGVTGLVACSFAVGAAIAAIAVGNRNRPVVTTAGHPLHGIVQKRMGLFRNFAKSSFQKPQPVDQDATYTLA